MQSAHASGMVFIAQTSTGIALESVDDAGVRKHTYEISSTAMLNVHALTANQDSAFFTISCPTGLGLIGVAGVDCTLANDRQRLITMEWDLQANTTSVAATAQWLSPLSNGLESGGENGAMNEILGPNPACTHALHASSTTLYSAANSHCGDRDHNTATAPPLLTC